MSTDRRAADPAREADDDIEIGDPPRFEVGERVASRHRVRNDGTFRGRDIGEVLVQRGDVGYVRSIGTYLQRFYVYAVEFADSGHQVGMRAKELCTLDRLPAEVIARLGDRAQWLQERHQGP